MRLPIPADWDGHSWCRWSICWPDSELWAGILRGFLTLPQRGRTWDERTGSILDVQAIGREISANNLPLECVIMSCGDAQGMIDALVDIKIALGEIRTAIELTGPGILAEKLDGLTEAIQDMSITVSPTITVSGCCTDGSPGGGQTININCGPVAPPPGAPGSGTPGAGPGPGSSTPPGLPAAVSERQCNMAQWLVDDYLHGIAANGDAIGADIIINNAIRLGGEYASVRVLMPVILGVMGTTAGLIGTPGPTPDDPIWGGIGLMLGLLIAAQVGEVDFSEISEFVFANRDELVCALASSANATVAQAQLMAIVEASTDPVMSGANPLLIQGLFSVPVLQLLFYVSDAYPALETFIAANFQEDCPCGQVDPSAGVQDLSYKCSAANAILDALDAQMETLSGLAGYAGTSFLGYLELLRSGNLLALWQSAIVEFPAVVAQAALASMSAFWSLVGNLIWIGWGFMAGFIQIAAHFTANRPAILCALAEAEDVAAAKVVLDQASGAAVTAMLAIHPEWADGESEYLRVLEGLYQTAVLNLLFPVTPDPEIEAYEGDPCDDCAGGEVPAACWEFDTDLQGFTVVNGTGGGSLTAAYDGVAVPPGMRVTTNDGVNSDIDRVVSPLFSHIIEAGDTVCVCGGSGTHVMYLFADLDGAEVLINEPASFTGSYTYTIDMTPYIGQTLSQIKFLIHKAGGGEFMFYQAGLNCIC